MCSVFQVLLCLCAGVAFGKNDGQDEATHIQAHGNARDAHRVELEIRASAPLVRRVRQEEAHPAIMRQHHAIGQHHRRPSHAKRQHKSWARTLARTGARAEARKEILDLAGYSAQEENILRLAAGRQMRRHAKRKKHKSQATSEIATGLDKGQPQPNVKVLYVIWSGAAYYKSRVRWGMKTWAKGLNASQLILIGDAKYTKLNGVTIHQTTCRDDHGAGLCCKYGEAVVAARAALRHNPNLEWAYFGDDDAYIRTAAFERAALQQTDRAGVGVVLGGAFGCATTNCLNVLCGGGGFAANRRALELMVGDDPYGFVREEVRRCVQCGPPFGDTKKGDGAFPFADAGMSDLIRSRGIEQRWMPGVYPWNLEKSCFDRSLSSPDEPLVYHAMRTKRQFEVLHRLFAGSSAPKGFNTTAAGVDLCAEFRGHVQCASVKSHIGLETPWLPSSSDFCMVDYFQPAISPVLYVECVALIGLCLMFLAKEWYQRFKQCKQLS